MNPPEITSYEFNGSTIYRAHHFSDKGYSTTTCASMFEARVWLQIQKGKP